MFLGLGWLGQAAGTPGVTDVAQLGISGLMGALWWWERKYSRQREDELTAAHQEILGQREHLQGLLDALEGNTKVISQFTAVQEEILHVMQGREGHVATGGAGAATSPGG